MNTCLLPRSSISSPQPPRLIQNTKAKGDEAKDEVRQTWHPHPLVEKSHKRRITTSPHQLAHVVSHSRRCSSKSSYILPYSPTSTRHHNSMTYTNQGCCIILGNARTTEEGNRIRKHGWSYLVGIRLIEDILDGFVNCRNGKRHQYKPRGTKAEKEQGVCPY